MNNLTPFNPSPLPPNWLPPTNPFPLPINPHAFFTQVSANPPFPAITGQQIQNPIAYLAVVTPIQAPNNLLAQAFSSSAFSSASQNPTTPQIKQEEVQVKQEVVEMSQETDDRLQAAYVKEEAAEILNQMQDSSSSSSSNSAPSKRARRAQEESDEEKSAEEDVESSSSKKRKATAQLKKEEKKQKNTQWQAKELEKFLDKHPEYDAAYFKGEDAIKKFRTVLKKAELGFSDRFLQRDSIVRVLRRKGLYEGELGPKTKALKEYMEKNYPGKTRDQILKKTTIKKLYKKYRADLGKEAISGEDDFSKALKDIGLGKTKKDNDLKRTVSEEKQQLVMEFVKATYKDLTVLQKKSAREIHEDAKEYFKKQGKAAETPGARTIYTTLKQKGHK